MNSPTSTNALEPKPMPELYHEVHNSDGKETILFIHGAGGSGCEWEEVIPLLVQNDYHVLLPDLPAHRKSVSIQSFTLDISAQLLLDLIDKHAKKGRAHIVGLSLGAHIAVRVAERAKPCQILSLIASGYNTIPQSKFVRSMVTVTWFLAHHLIGFVQRPKKEVAQMMNGEASYGLIAELTKTILEPRVLGEIRVRTLVICAADRKTWLAKDKPESARQLFEKVVEGKENGSRLVVHYGVRHSWQVEEPKLFADTVLAWIREEPLHATFEDIE